MATLLEPSIGRGSDDAGTLRLAHPLVLDCGRALEGVEIAYRRYGTLNADRSNVVLVAHALTGDQHAVGRHPVTGKTGWWETLIGPGRPIDTDRLHVVVANVIGGCMGSTGPASLDPSTGKAYALDFPVVTIADMVRAHVALLDALGIERLFAAVGGSMGGMQVLQFASAYPDRVACAVPIATAAKHTPQNIAFHEVGRQAVMADPNWMGGDYLASGARPAAGLAVARMAAHVTYLSESALTRKFGRQLQDRDAMSYGFEADFQIESYLRHQGMTFVERFDANSYLYLTRAMDYFDLAADFGGRLADAFRGGTTRFCAISFTSDWLFPTDETRLIVHALNAAGAPVSFVEVESDKGHDAFLLDEPVMHDAVRGFLAAAMVDLGVRAP